MPLKNAGLNPLLDLNISYYENFSYSNPNGNSLELVPVCESFNTSHWQQIPYYGTIRVIDTENNKREIESEIFNLSRSAQGLVLSFTSCIILNFTANENRTLSYFYASSPKESPNYKALEIIETESHIIINNSGYYIVTLNKAVGGIGLLEDWEGQRYYDWKRLSQGGLYSLVGSAGELNTNMLGTIGPEINDATCKILERGNLRVKIQCKNTTGFHQQYYYTNFTFYKGSYFWEQLMGKTNAGD